MRKIFGTDGVRGIANKELTAELALNLGRAAGFIFKNGASFLVGEDTRVSSPMLRNAVSAGIASIGVDVVQAGIVPTPAVSLFTRLMHFSSGIVVSASHNPVEYNGIKLFDIDGCKLKDELEEKIEQILKDNFKGYDMPHGDALGRITVDETFKDKYISHLYKRFPLDLNGVKIVVDSAFGATYYTTPVMLKACGGEVIPYNNEPDGKKINVNCGSTTPSFISSVTVKIGADIGIAHDGDGDRVIFSDENGTIVDGDETMLIISRHLKSKGFLVNDTVVGTVMSNIGIEKAFKESGIRFVRAPVGDRYVLEEMNKQGAIVGGEQSGHIIFIKENHTGDGLVTALVLLSVMKETGKPLSELRRGIVHFPQILVNMDVKSKKIIQKESVKQFIQKEQLCIEGRGRILVRPSGTEPLIRIMVEGESESEIKEIADRIRLFIEEEK
ncbi:MAG: phosphoglucosamine mutase [Caldisericota bacterium]|nr:phosphoglucosamine mutase [Caldisericota bacterium]